MSLSNSQKPTRVGAKMIPVQSKLFRRVLQEPNTLLVPGIRVISSAEGRKSYTHGTQNHLSHGITYQVYRLQQFVPAGTAAHNQDRRQAGDGGRAMYVHSKYSSSTCSSRLYTCFSNYIMCFNSGTAVYSQHKRRWASDGGRSICTQQYSSTCSINSIYIFFAI